MRALLLLLVSLQALADPIRTDPTPDVTVFADGDHSVTLVAPSGIFGVVPFNRVMGVHKGSQTKTHRILAGQRNAWITRTRVVDGRVICEVFAERPYGETAQKERADELFKEPCA